MTCFKSPSQTPESNLERSEPRTNNAKQKISSLQRKICFSSTIARSVRPNNQLRSCSHESIYCSLLIGGEFLILMKCADFYYRSNVLASGEEFSNFSPLPLVENYSLVPLYSIGQKINSISGKLRCYQIKGNSILSPGCA